MISTLVMVKLGKTYGNLMVDLRATNEKLLARSQRTVQHATGVSAQEAAAALDSVGGSVKAAILVLLTGIELVRPRVLWKKPAVSCGGPSRTRSNAVGGVSPSA